MEKSVLEGWVDSKQRPWIIVVESTIPNTTLGYSKSFSNVLDKMGYTFAYFDGLSKFYISCKHSSLKRDLELPPNVFDGFKKQNE
jgi:hypothetical protein